MMQTNSDYRLRILAWAGLCLVAILTSLSLWAGHRYRRSAAWRDHSVRVTAQSEASRLHLITSESALRGYLLTQEKGLLTQYFREKALALEKLAGLAALVSDNPRQSNLLQSIAPLMAAKFEFSEIVIQYVKDGRAQQGIAAVREGQGRDLMNSLAGFFEQFEQAEIKLLEERGRAADREFAWTGFFITIGMILALFLILLHKRLLRRENFNGRKLLRELAEAEARASEASKLKSHFLANMSHEIRTPLNGILGMAKLLETTGLNAEQRDFLETLKTSSHSLLALINQILDFSKIESGKLQLEEVPFELNSLIQSTLAIVEYSALAKNLRIISSVAPDVHEFYLGDSLRLRQVLLNLLNNSIKFSERGTVRLNVVRMRAADSQATLAFEVIDEGIGIDPALASRVFDTFVQGDASTSRKFGGSGLGLAISKQIVEMMGGRLAFESEPGKGSRFYFTAIFKIAKFRTENTGELDDSLAPKELGAHLLVAEDNRVNQKVVSEMVKLLGCSAKIVANGHEVLAALRSEKFDLILMDGQMPDMDGYEASKRIRAGEAGEASRDIPILATTADAIKGDVERSLEAGMNDYISKPISYYDLAFKVEKWFKCGKYLIDASAISRLRNLGITAGENLIPGLVEIFGRETTAALRDMEAALESNRAVDVSRIAHSLKSAAANLGAVRVQEIAGRIEKGQTSAALIGVLRREFLAALTELQKLS